MRIIIAVCAALGAIGVIANFIRLEMLFREDEKRIMAWLRIHSGWHYGSVLVERGLASREMICVFLDRLEECGFVQRRVGAAYPEYRATPHEELFE